VAGIYNLDAPKENMLKPEEWNRTVITCQGSSIAVALNGETVVEARKNPDGSSNTFGRPLRDFARHRNIRLKTLEGK
jgi:hypothetical protein